MPLVVFFILIFSIVNLAEAAGALPLPMETIMKPGVDFAKNAQEEEDGSAAQQFGYSSADMEPDKDRLKSSQTVLVREVRIHDAGGISEAEKKALAAPYEGRTLTFQDLQALKNDIFNYYLAKGYMFARVFLPTQNVTDGDVDFYVRESNIGRISLVADERVRSNARVMAWMKKLREAKTEKQYMRVLKIMQKAAGYKVVAAVVPMKDDPSVFEMRVQIKEDRLSGRMGVSNALMREEVGPIVGNGGVEFKNFLGLNEKLEFDAQVAVPPRELVSISSSLAVPVGADGFGLLGGVSASKSEPSKVDGNGVETPSGQVSGRYRGKVGAVYPFFLGSNVEFSTEVALYKYLSDMDTYHPDLPIVDRSLPLTEQRTQYGWGRIKFRLKGATGPVSHVLLLSGSYQPEHLDGDVTTVNASGLTVKKDINRARGIFGNYNVYIRCPNMISVAFTFLGQVSFDKRQVLDQFRPVGDFRSTIAYPSATLSGDSGFSGRMGISKAFLAGKGLVLAPYVFGSYGSAWAFEKINGSYNYSDLLSCGLGIDISFAQKFAIKLEYGHPLGPGFERGILPKGKEYSDHFVFSVSSTF